MPHITQTFVRGLRTCYGLDFQTVLATAPTMITCRCYNPGLNSLAGPRKYHSAAHVTSKLKSSSSNDTSLLLSLALDSCILGYQLN
jgi:hypothetical protein